LHSVISGVLEKYKIGKTQIIAHISDNAANVLACGIRLREEQGSMLVSEEIEDSRSRWREDDSEVELLENEDDDGDKVAEMMKSIREAIEMISSLMTAMRCSLHTLQLAVGDAIKDIGRDAQCSLSRLRTVIKNLKSSAFTRHVKEIDLRNMSLDVVTRWGSTYIMAKSVLDQEEKLKALISRVEDKMKDQLVLSDETFDFLRKFTDAFQSTFNLTLQLQKVNLSLGMNSSTRI
jgi:hypothetical protein